MPRRCGTSIAALFARLAGAVAAIERPPRGLVQESGAYPQALRWGAAQPAPLLSLAYLLRRGGNLDHFGEQQLVCWGGRWRLLAGRPSPFARLKGGIRAERRDGSQIEQIASSNL
ncbi:hypothetical protein CERSUDRAFT_119473 [Gelatoporia subvermispora B]|uniref:Uncharacterized protein n=1 Tax=Ceriporiopsis subvermispora (strain B) TaxID=914234 RepID=M2R082_CERS8|nr:hypothetical protein CERSUDRAFT_119473 [Gelatoporia subvermispora B]